MSHYYHKHNGRWQRWIPLKNDGTEYQRITKKMAAEAGAVIGITSQIGNHTDKGYLIPWIGRLGIQAGWEVAQEAVSNGGLDDPLLHDITEADMTYAKEILTRNQEAAANKGNEFHDAIEDYINGKPLPEDAAMRNACVQVKAWLTEHGVEFTDHGVQAEHCVGFNGGIIPREDPMDAGICLHINNGATADLITKRLLVDWKTVEKAKDGRYYTGKPEHCAQLAFCRHAAWNEKLCDPDAECCNVYINRNTGEIVEVKEWTGEQLDAGLEFVGWACECDNALARLEGMLK